MNLDPNSQGAALSLLMLYENELIEFKNVVEFLALFTGDKKVVRLVLTDEQAHQVVSALTQYCSDIDHDSSQFVLREVFKSTQWDSFHERHFKAVKEKCDVRAQFFGKRQFVKLAIEAEDDEADALTLGELFGIPKCCAQTYQKYLNTSGKWMANYLQTPKVISWADAISNRFSSVVGYQMGFHNDYFPCSFDCEQTLQISRANRERLLHYDFDALVELAEANSEGTTIALNDHVFYKAGKSVRDALMSGREVSIAEFKSLTPNAPDLPRVITNRDSRLQTNDSVKDESFEKLSVCCFELQGDLK